MKKLVFVLSVAAIVIFVAVSVSYARVYTVVQLTNNSYPDIQPAINNNGVVAWSGWDGNDFEIFLYRDSSITQITDNAYDDTQVQINDRGYLTWTGWDGNDNEIFLYNGSAIIQLTNNSMDDQWPQINYNGYIVWQVNFDMEIWLYNGSTIEQFGTYDAYYPQINDNGYVAYYDPSDSIGLAPGFGPLPRGGFGSMDRLFPIQINNDEDVVWVEDGPNNILYEVFLFKASTYTTTQISGDNPNGGSDPINFFAPYPAMNNNGYVAWNSYYDVGPEFSPVDIFLYDGSTTTQLGYHSGQGEYNGLCDINDNNDLVWQVWPYLNDPFIVFYDGSTITKISDVPPDDDNYLPNHVFRVHNSVGPFIANDGYIVWQGTSILFGGPDYSEIFLAIPIPGWELNMDEMNWYTEIGPYNSTGAASCQMILNYIREGAGEPILTQDEIYEYAKMPLAYGDLTPDEVSKALGHFDPYDYLVSNADDVDDSLPGGNPHQGYNFGIDTYNPALDTGAMNKYMRDICHWMAYTVTQENWQDDGALVARPNTPAAVPIFGSYENWVVVKGFVVSDNPAPTPHTDPWNTPDFTVYGFWIKDPQIPGIGQNTYKTAAECESTYFLPLAMDPYSSMLLQVAEPPLEMSNANVEITRPDIKLSNLEFIGVRQKTASIGNGGAAQYADSSQSGQAVALPQSWRDLVDPYLLSDPNATGAFEGAEIGKPVFVTRTDVDGQDYYLVPFGRDSEEGFTASAVVILDAKEGYFKEASWTDNPAELLRINKDEAVRLVTGRLSTPSYDLDVTARLIWQPNGYSPSPYEPYWEVSVNVHILYFTKEIGVIPDKPILKRQMKLY